MSDRLIPAILATAGGIVLALLLLVPWVAREYRRRGQLGFGRTLLALGFVTHSLSLITYTLLPLPDVYPGFCAEEGASGAQLVPFQFVADIQKHAVGTSGASALLGNPAVQQVLFNVALFVPLGMFVRYLLHRGAMATIAIGFGASLLVELTQVTGVWFLYPCAYRLLDVDDLLANTAGVAFGLLLAPLLALVGRNRGSRPAESPRPVTARRRLLGILCDMAAVALTGAFLHTLVLMPLLVLSPAVNDLPAPIEAVLTVLVPALLILVLPTQLGNGGTLGQRAVLLRPALPDGVVPTRRQRLNRVMLGIGLYFLLDGLSTAGFPLVGAFANVFGLVSLIGVWRSVGHRGVGGRFTGLRMIDERESRTADTPTEQMSTTT